MHYIGKNSTSSSNKKGVAVAAAERGCDGGSGEGEGGSLGGHWRRFC